MLLAGINDDERSLEAIAEFLAKADPAVAYISVPTRPPAEKWAASPSEESINQAYQIFSSRLKRAELLVGYEGDSFQSTGNAESDLLSIAAVHPIIEEAALKFLSRLPSGREDLQKLVDRGELIKTEYMGHNFYLRRRNGRAK